MFGFGNNIMNLKAFELFFEGFYPSVCAFSQKYIKDAGLAEDFAQEAFVEFWKKKEDFTDLKGAKGFIYTITKNKCLNHIKQTIIREKILKDEIFSDDYFYEIILEEETYQIVHKAINKLSPQSSKIVWLSMEGNKNQEIADQLNVSINTVKTLKKNAYKTLRMKLSDQLFLLALFFNFFR